MGHTTSQTISSVLYVHNTIYFLHATIRSKVESEPNTHLSLTSFLSYHSRALGKVPPIPQKEVGYLITKRFERSGLRLWLWMAICGGDVLERREGVTGQG